MSEVLYPDVKARRDLLREERKCINGPMVGSVGRYGVVHGKPIKAGKCRHCVAVHRGPVIDPLSVACLRCGAEVGVACHSVAERPLERELKASHHERLVAARRSAS